MSFQLNLHMYDTDVNVEFSYDAWLECWNVSGFTTDDESITKRDVELFCDDIIAENEREWDMIERRSQRED